MIPRGHLDIGWSDLLYAFASCLRPGDRAAAERRVELVWSDEGDALACLSVRSGFDLLLTALDYPPGSEILVSAINIRDMVRIVHEHGLIPVPVDLDMETLSVKAASLERSLSPRTKAVLVAHLFGDQMRLDAVARFARERGLLLVEDCAQSFTGRGDRGHPASDVSMFSFGPIKTATALGGAMLRVGDRRLRARMREIQSRYPLQTRGHFLRRVCRFALVRLAGDRLPFTLFCAACRLLGRNHDEVINRSIRGFRGPRFLDNLRRRPGHPLLALLRRRISGFDEARVARRVVSAHALIRMVSGIPRPGTRAARHSHWTFPVLSAEPDELVRRLWSRGFDATRGAWSLCAVPAPAGHEHAAAIKAEETMRRLVYLPTYPAVRSGELPRLARAAIEADTATRPAPKAPARPPGTTRPGLAR